MVDELGGTGLNPADIEADDAYLDMLSLCDQMEAYVEAETSDSLSRGRARGRAQHVWGEDPRVVRGLG